MRELSFNEIELVSGGFSVSDTVAANSVLNTLSQASLRSIANSAISAARTDTGTGVLVGASYYAGYSSVKGHNASVAGGSLVGGAVGGYLNKHIGPIGANVVGGAVAAGTEIVLEAGGKIANKINTAIANRVALLDSIPY